MNEFTPAQTAKVARTDVSKVPDPAVDPQLDLRREPSTQSMADQCIAASVGAVSSGSDEPRLGLLSEHDPSAVSQNSPTTFVAIVAPRLGRPRQFEEKTHLEVCALVSAGMTLAQSASYLGISRATIYREMERDPEFAESVGGARQVAQGQLILQLAQAGKTSWKAAAYLLEHLEKRAGKARQRKRTKEAEAQAAERERNRPKRFEELEPGSLAKLFDKRGNRIKPAPNASATGQR